MNFGPDHYVPVLKCKIGEKRALQLVAEALRPRITPLLEIVERKSDKPLTEHLDTAFKGLAVSVSGYSRCFLDAREVAPDGPAAAEAAFQRAVDAEITFTPVTGISRQADVGAALSHGGLGIALRLSRAEFEQGNLATKLLEFMASHDLAREETDLIVDLGPVDDMIVEGVTAFGAAFLADVPDHPAWRTLTISACGFPPSMGVVERLSYELVSRVDWRAWRDSLHEHRHAIPRVPSFSDCAIQHPRGVEGFDPRIMQVSASIRYTRPEEWLLIKGEGTRANPAKLQFPALATQLVYGHLRPHFAGPSHCRGCFLIKAAADGAAGMGSAEPWRRVGTAHHITMVVQALESLSWT